MNALSLYVTTCRMIFQADINNSGAWNDINRLIMYFRQSLTCIVCGQLLKIPMSSSVASCHHHVCKSCINGKMRLKPSCSYCKDYSKFIENIQLRILLQCYKRLTIYLKKSEISKKWATLQTGNTPGVLIANSIYNQNQCPSSFKDLIDEGANLQDNKYTFFEPPSLRNLNNKSSNQSNLNGSSSTTSLENLDTSKLIQLNTTNLKIMDKDHDLLNKSSHQATIIRLNTNQNNSISNQLIHNSLTNHQLNSSLNQSTNLTNTSTTTSTPSKSKHKIKKGCRCGLATLNPGKLTCCGQRCPCYVEGKACFTGHCRCRGCKNTNNNNNSNNNNGNNNNNLLTTRSSPSYTTTNNTLNNQIITTNNTSSSNLLSTSPNLQLNNLNQTTLISSTSSTRNLLSPSFLLSSTSTINSSNSNSNANQMLRNTNSMFSTTVASNKINISSPCTILLSHQNVASVDSLNTLTLPFPNIEDQVILSSGCIEEDSSLNQINSIITVNENDEL